jgi:putative redox protein
MAGFVSTWAGGKRFLHTGATGHAVVTDAGETAVAPTPMEFILHALAGCAGIDVVNILTKMRQPLEGLEIVVEAVRADEHPRVYTEIRLEYRVRGAVAEDKLQQALKLSSETYCSVAAMLRPAVPVFTSYVILGR